MRTATEVTVATFGTLAGLAGIEHGIGEILQGNRAPDGVMILSWPDAELLRGLAGEPAMTLVPKLLVTGILATLVSLIFLVWATVWVQRKNAGLVLILLSVVMLLVGAGYGPPLLGILLAGALIGSRASLIRKRIHPPVGAGRILGKLWWGCLGTGLVAWLLLMPGSLILGYFVGVDAVMPVLPVLILSAFGLLLLTLFTGLAYDARRQTGFRQPMPNKAQSRY